ncbi:MAG TPA: hypothetical protein VMX33_15140 [bacterium]|nr:hypothetical protein [bacterium]
MTNEQRQRYESLAALFGSDAAREIVLFDLALEALAATPQGAALLADNPPAVYARIMARIRLRTNEKNPAETMRRLKEQTGLSAAQLAEEMHLPRGLVVSLLSGNPKARVYDLRVFMVRAQSTYHLFKLEGSGLRLVRRNGAPMVFDPRRAVAV